MKYLSLGTKLPIILDVFTSFEVLALQINSVGTEIREFGVILSYARSSRARRKMTTIAIQQRLNMSCQKARSIVSGPSNWFDLCSAHVLYKVLAET